jgi:integrase
MTRIANKLTAVKVERASKRGLYGDGNGLYLQIAKHGTKSWLLRYMLNGQARNMGLGPLHSVTLAEARERAREARSQIAQGHDPLSGKKVHARNLSRTFDVCAREFIEAHGPTFKNPKHRAQWGSSLAAYASPAIGSPPVSLVDTARVMRVLQPIWHKVPETASRVRQRIERVLDWAAVQGFRKGENPARWKGHLDMLLPAKGKVKKAEHHAALPYADLPAFMLELDGKKSISARALEFAILTATRTGEVIGATWSEVDFDSKLWTIPAERMKAGKEHRVPLCDRAVELLKALPRDDDRIFPLSNMAMLNLLKGMRPDLTTHGFRSTFSDWARDTTSYPRDVIEAALAHAIESKAEAAYRRGDALEKRVRLMADWSNFASGGFGGDVVQLRA